MTPIIPRAEPTAVPNHAAAPPTSPAQITPAPPVDGPLSPTPRLSAGERLGFVYGSLGFFVVLAGVALGAALVFGAGFVEWLLTTTGMGVLLVAINLVINLDLLARR